MSLRLESWSTLLTLLFAANNPCAYTSTHTRTHAFTNTHERAAMHLLRIINLVLEVFEHLRQRRHQKQTTKQNCGCGRVRVPHLDPAALLQLRARFLFGARRWLPARP